MNNNGIIPGFILLCVSWIVISVLTLWHVDRQIFPELYEKCVSVCTPHGGLVASSADDTELTCFCKEFEIELRVEKVLKKNLK